MAIKDKTYIRQLSIGYDLDGGGYSFDTPTIPELAAFPCVVWEQPDLDYVNSDGCPRGHSADLLVFAPNSGHFPAIEFPECIPQEDGELVRVGAWSTTETDHECNCHGKLVEYNGAAGEGPALSTEQVIKFVQAGVELPEAQLSRPALAWEFTGSTSDHAYPDCDRCEGDGYVTSHGGEWAVYEYVPDDDEEEEEEEDDQHDFEDREDFLQDCDFADPGGTSALRVATPSNPRNLPCPTCERPNRLTPADRARHYQCDQCADQDERGGY